MNDDELINHHRATFEAADEKRRVARAQKAQSDDRFAFFSTPNAEADWGKWLKKVVWTAEEAAALSFGKDPGTVNTASLKRRPPILGSPFRTAFFDRLDNIDRAISAKQLNEKFKPVDFLNWAQKEKIELPNQWQ